jgi:hypothetical protein
MTAPAMPRTCFITIQSKFILGAFKAFFDCPTMAFQMNQAFNRAFCRTPSREICQFTVRDISSNQKTARPQIVKNTIEFVTA